MNARNLTRLAAAAAVAAMLASASPSFGYRMIQVTGTGRYTSGAAVTCDDFKGFAHRNNGIITGI